MTLVSEHEQQLISELMAVVKAFGEKHTLPPYAQAKLLSNVSLHMLAQQIAFVSVFNQGGNRETQVKNALAQLVSYARLYEHEIKAARDAKEA